MISVLNARWYVFASPAILIVNGETCSTSNPASCSRFTARFTTSSSEKKFDTVPEWNMMLCLKH